MIPSKPKPIKLDGDPKWYCLLDKCGKSFGSKDATTRHLKGHGNQKLFECPAITCSKRDKSGYTRKYNLDIYMKNCRHFTNQSKGEQDLAPLTKEDTVNEQLFDYWITNLYSIMILWHGHKDRQKINACTEWPLETLWSALDMPIDGRLWWLENASKLQNAKVITDEDQYCRFIS